MSEQNMDPKKRNIIIGCSVAGAVVVIAAIIAVIFTTGALNKIGIGSSSANTVSYSDTERFSQGISIEEMCIRDRLCSLFTNKLKRGMPLNRHASFSIFIILLLTN